MVNLLKFLFGRESKTDIAKKKAETAFVEQEEALCRHKASQSNLQRAVDDCYVTQQNRPRILERVTSAKKESGGNVALGHQT